MKTTLDLPRPLLLRVASRAAKLRVSVSRYVALSLERGQPVELPQTESVKGKSCDELFEQMREELGL